MNHFHQIDLDVIFATSSFGSFNHERLIYIAYSYNSITRHSYYISINNTILYPLMCIVTESLAVHSHINLQIKTKNVLQSINNLNPLHSRGESSSRLCLVRKFGALCTVLLYLTSCLCFYFIIVLFVVCN